jgi:fumarylacetoacetase
MNETHDARLKSWIESANDRDNDFPIQNLPYGVFEPGVIGVAIGDRILNLRACGEAGLLPAEAADAMNAPVLNVLMALNCATQSALRTRISELLRHGGGERARAQSALIRQSDVAMAAPVAIGDYTDFYASEQHATNVGRLFRPQNPLLPNYKWIPIAYHGRASSIVVSGTRIRRPSGQQKSPDAEAPEFGPSRSLDYEMETGFFVGRGNDLGIPVPIEDAGEHLFGMCLLNDWSARDIQAWEYQPLGPFLGKNFATTISPWVVTMEALEPFRCGALARPDGDPEPLSYLSSRRDREAGAIEMRLSAAMLSRHMRERRMGPMLLGATDLKNLYWTPSQMLAHHTSNGCRMRTGDLLGSGTVSGATPGEFGSLIEITRRGAEPVTLPTGEQRRFLEDGDEVTLRGWCERAGYARIGLGTCTARIG